MGEGVAHTSRDRRSPGAAWHRRVAGSRGGAAGRRNHDGRLYGYL